MKKLLALLLALAMAVSLFACGGNNSTPVASKEPDPVASKEPEVEVIEEQEPETPKYNLGDTVSTDIIDFTLNDVVFSIYASATSSSWATPIDHSDGGIFVASVGRSLACLSFVVKNKDRGSLSIGRYSAWDLDTLSIVSNGTEYPVKGYDSDGKDGSDGLRMDRGTINGIIADTWSYIMDTGETIKVQIVGIVSVEKDNLSDAYTFKIGIPNSSDEVEYFEYAISK